jgi:hypothetical protein
MLNASRFKKPTSLISIGLVFIAIANVSQYLLQHHTAVSESIADGLSGFLFGIAIGTTLLGIYLQSRAMRRGGPRSS